MELNDDSTGYQEYSDSSTSCECPAPRSAGSKIRSRSSSAKRSKTGRKSIRGNKYERPPSLSVSRSNYKSRPLPPPPPPPPANGDEKNPVDQAVLHDMRRAISEPCALKRLCSGDEKGGFVSMSLYQENGSTNQNSNGVRGLDGANLVGRNRKPEMSERIIDGVPRHFKRRPSAMALALPKDRVNMTFGNNNSNDRTLPVLAHSRQRLGTYTGRRPAPDVPARSSVLSTSAHKSRSSQSNDLPGVKPERTRAYDGLSNIAHNADTSEVATSRAEEITSSTSGFVSSACQEGIRAAQNETPDIHYESGPGRNLKEFGFIPVHKKAKYSDSAVVASSDDRSKRPEINSLDSVNKIEKSIPSGEMHDETFRPQVRLPNGLLRVGITSHCDSDAHLRCSFQDDNKGIPLTEQRTSKNNFIDQSNGPFANTRDFLYLLGHGHKVIDSGRDRSQSCTTAASSFGKKLDNDYKRTVSEEVVSGPRRIHCVSSVSSLLGSPGDMKTTEVYYDDMAQETAWTSKTEDSKLYNRSSVDDCKPRQKMTNGIYEKIGGKCKLAMLLIPSFLAVICAVLFGLSVAGVFVPKEVPASNDADRMIISANQTTVSDKSIDATKVTNVETTKQTAMESQELTSVIAEPTVAEYVSETTDYGPSLMSANAEQPAPTTVRENPALAKGTYRLMSTLTSSSGNKTTFKTNSTEPTSPSHNLPGTAPPEHEASTSAAATPAAKTRKKHEKEDTNSSRSRTQRQRGETSESKRRKNRKKKQKDVIPNERNGGGKNNRTTISSDGGRTKPHKRKSNSAAAQVERATSNTSVTNSEDTRGAVESLPQQSENHEIQRDDVFTKKRNSRRKKSDDIISLPGLSEVESKTISRATSKYSREEEKEANNDEVIYGIYYHIDDDSATAKEGATLATAPQERSDEVEALAGDVLEVTPDQEYQDACVRIPHSKCEAVLPYEFTPFLADESSTADAVSSLYKIILQSLGVDVRPTEKLPKKKSAAKKISKSSTRSFLNPRKILPIINNHDCDVQPLLRLVCHLRFPPCIGTSNFTESVDSVQFNSSKDDSSEDSPCNRWCTKAFSACLDLKTLLRIRTIYKGSEGDSMPLGLIVKDTRYFGNTVVHSGVLSIGVLTDGSIPNVVNGLETAGLQLLPESAGFKTLRESKALAAHVCKRIYPSSNRVLMTEVECLALNAESAPSEVPITSNEQDEETYPADENCGDEFFRCKSGICLDWNWTCNGQNDCGEWEDEIGCECFDGQLQCANGQCVQQGVFCDGYYDCVDRSDERNCSFCEYGLYQCGSANQCVVSSWWCDGDVDCDNGADEKYCSCESHGQVSCESGNLCVPKHYRCDGDNDCQDASDEKDCVEAIKRCAAWEIYCSNKCVPVSAMCDGIRDCAMGEDEEDCGQCEPVELEACRGTPYNVTSQPNFLRHQSQMKTAMSSEYALFRTILHTRCHPLLRQFGCSILAPPPTISVAKGSHCPLNNSRLPTYSPPRLLPCRELCETVRSACSNILSSVSLSWPSFLSCQSLPPENSPKTADDNQAKICLDYETMERASCSVGEFRCATGASSGPGTCLPTSARCDGVRHCNDGSDEMSCDCDRLGRLSCGNSQRCIPKEWKCDGHIDCPNGFDEAKCSNCTISEKTCDDYSCIDWRRWCDGVDDCPDGSDEERCIKLIPRHHAGRYAQDARRLDVDWSVREVSGVLIGWREERWSPICAEGWSSLLSHLSCNQMGFSEALLVTTVHSRGKLKRSLHANKHVRVKTVQESFLTRVGPCRTNRIIHLTCKPKFCGTKIPTDALTHAISSRVFGGKTARTNAWPWIASLTLPGMRHVCGATLIGPQWLISAAHCFQGRDDVGFWRAKFGTANQDDEQNMQGLSTNITDIIIHPRFDSRSMDFDVALVRLDRALSSSEGVAPVCLAPVPTKTGAYCHIAGWGVTGKSSRGARKLQEAAVHIIGRGDCQRYYPKHVLTDRMICAGHQSGSVDACSGDSGGPMTCWQPEFRQWYLAGVTSWGSACMPHVAPGVYTNIPYFSKWIAKTTKEVG